MCWSVSARTSVSYTHLFIYGVQLGLSYKINDWLAVFGGGRMNYFSGGYEGFLTAKVNTDLPGMPIGTELAGIELDLSLIHIL